MDWQQKGLENTQRERPVTTPPNHSVVRSLENTDGVHRHPFEGGSAHPGSVRSGFGSKLPLPFYADVRSYIPMTHHHGRLRVSSMQIALQMVLGTAVCITAVFMDEPSAFFGVIAIGCFLYVMNCIFSFLGVSIYNAFCTMARVSAHACAVRSV